MSRSRNHVLIAAGLAVLVTVVGVFSAGPVIAQAVKPALVLNVDDPGRTPYSLHGACSLQQVCQVPLPPVPTGEGLVITHVSGVVVDNLPGGTLIEISIARQARQQITNFPVTFTGLLNGFNHFVFNEQVLMFYNARDAPLVVANLGSASNADSYLKFTLSG